MDGRTFALHSRPIDRTALYVVYSESGRNGYEIKRCDEFDFVIKAIQACDKALYALKQEFADSLDCGEYLARKKQITAKLKYLHSERKRISEKYHIQSGYKGEIDFKNILVDELYKMMDKDKFEAAMRNAKAKYYDLTTGAMEKSND